MAVVRYYLPVEKVRDILASRKWYGFDYFLAAALGTITPFCSCSSIPLFVGFVGAGIPMGVTFAFLIASPLVNEASLFIFPSIFGLKITFLYNILGILISVAAGMAIQRLKLEKSVNPAFLQYKTRQDAIKENGGRKVPLTKKIAIWRQDYAYHQRDLSYIGLWRGHRRVDSWLCSREFVESNLSAADWWGALGSNLACHYTPIRGRDPDRSAGRQGRAVRRWRLEAATVTLSLPRVVDIEKAMDWKLLAARYHHQHR